jgi:hypothetical protein
MAGGCAISLGFKPKMPPNKSLKPNAYRRDFSTTHCQQRL